MSQALEAAVWDRSRQRGSALVVLLALADAAREDGWAWPRVAALAERARVSERYARKLLARLDAAGEVSRDRLPDDRRRRAYFLTVAREIAARARKAGSAASPRAEDDGRLGRPVQGGQPVMPPAPSRRIAAVARLWDGLPPEVERPGAGRISTWLRAWGDDQKLREVLAELRRRGKLDVSVNYTHTCLANALRQGGRLPDPAPGERRAPADRFREQQAALTRIEPAAPFDLAARLAGLVEALPADLPDREARARAILFAGEAAPGTEAIERALHRLEEAWLDPLDAAASGDADLAAEVSAATARIAARLPPDAQRELARGLRRRILRRRAGLPLLSLFAPVAEAAEARRRDAAHRPPHREPAGDREGSSGPREAHAP